MAILLAIGCQKAEEPAPLAVVPEADHHLLPQAPADPGALVDDKNGQPKAAFSISEKKQAQNQLAPQDQTPRLGDQDTVHLHLQGVKPEQPKTAGTELQAAPASGSDQH